LQRTPFCARTAALIRSIVGASSGSSGWITTRSSVLSLLLISPPCEAPQGLGMTQPSAQPHEQEEHGRAHERLTVLHVRRDGAPEEARDEEQPDRSRPRDQKEHRAKGLSRRDQQ